MIRLGNGAKLRTNPGASVGWTAPFWAFGCLQIRAAMTIVRVGSRGDRATAPETAGI